MNTENQLAMTFNKFLGEFEDQQLEAEFLRHETSGAIDFIRPATMVLGILFFLFIIPDYFLIESSQTFRSILYVRGAFLLLVTVLYTGLKYWPDQFNLPHWISIYELIVSTSFLLIYYLYESPNFFIQSFGAVALILAFFYVANRWIYALAISLFLAAGFMIISVIRPEATPASEFAAVVVYPVLIVLMSSVFSNRINLYKRMQYANNKELQRLSETDELTGINARRKLDREINRWMGLARRYNHPLSLVMFDIDDLKSINDNYGHLIGDRVLSAVAEVVDRELRSSDIFARWGGDEFAILLPHTTRQQAYELAERIRDTISAHKFEQAGYITCSFGVAEFRKDDDINSFLARADQRLYEAKTTGRDLVI